MVFNPSAKMMNVGQSPKTVGSLPYVSLERGTNIVATVNLNRVFDEVFTTLSEFIGMREVLVLGLACRSLSV